MREIRVVTIIGANGTMGSGCGGLIAGFGNAEVNMIARNIDKSQYGIERAIDSIRSDTIREKLHPGTFDKLSECIPESDWILETVAENYQAKEEINKIIRNYRKPGTIVSTVSSGLSIEKLSSVYDTNGREHYFGTHFYNPPYKMLLCELVPHRYSNNGNLQDLIGYLEKKLLRQVVVTADRPAFAGNRVGFQFLNEIAQYAEKYKDKGGIALMDTIIGCYTGRAMPPLVTVDMVGLDIHKAIVDNLYNSIGGDIRDTFLLPSYVNRLVNLGKLGKKSGEGLYKTRNKSDGKKERMVYDIQSKTYIPFPRISIAFVEDAFERIAYGDYRAALEVILKAEGEMACICRYFFARYISYSMSIIGEVVKSSECIDRVMGFGFNWVPPTALISLFGGVEVVKQIIQSAGLRIPEILNSEDGIRSVHHMRSPLDGRVFFKVK